MNQDESQNPEEQQQPKPARQDMVRSNSGSNDAHGHDTDPKEPRLRRRRATVKYLQAVFSGLLVIVTIIYTTFSYWQWQATQDALQLTQRTIEIADRQAKTAQEANDLTRDAQKRSDDLMADTERPWVGLNTSEVIGYALGQRVGAKLHILNSGKTPAFNLTIETTINWIAQGAPLIPPSNRPATKPNELASQGVLFPNQIVSQTILSIEYLSQDLFDKLQSSYFSLLFFGIITGVVTSSGTGPSRTRPPSVR